MNMYMSKSKYERKLKKIERKNISYKRKQDLKEQKEYLPKPPSMSKIVLIAVALLCVEIVAFCEYIMIATGDTSALYAMIGVPVTIVPVVISYYNKSAKENTVGGIVYETAMNEYYEPVG